MGCKHFADKSILTSWSDLFFDILFRLLKFLYGRLRKVKIQTHLSVVMHCIGNCARTPRHHLRRRPAVRRASFSLAEGDAMADRAGPADDAARGARRAAGGRGGDGMQERVRQRLEGLMPVRIRCRYCPSLCVPANAMTDRRDFPPP